jgi:hypothetical protein
MGVPCASCGPDAASSLAAQVTLDMNIGTGWLIIEESYHTNTNTLISIISTRKPASYILEYLEKGISTSTLHFMKKLHTKKIHIHGLLEHIL